jgi:hypothetical protein
MSQQQTPVVQQQQPKAPPVPSLPAPLPLDGAALRNVSGGTSTSAPGNVW